MLNRKLHRALPEVQLYFVARQRSATLALNYTIGSLQLLDAAAYEAPRQLGPLPDNPDMSAHRKWTNATPIETAFKHDLEDMLGVVELSQLWLALAAHIEGFAMDAPEAQA